MYINNMKFINFNPLILIKIIQIFLLIEITLGHQTSSQFIEIPKNQTVSESKSITFQCKSSMEERHRYSWYLNGKEIQTSPRIILMDSTLIILKAIKNIDEGEYVCIATSGLTGAREAAPSAYLHILKMDDDFDSSLVRGKRGGDGENGGGGGGGGGGGIGTDGNTILKIRENKFAQMSCDIVANRKLRNFPTIIVKWQKDGKLFREASVTRDTDKSTAASISSFNGAAMPTSGSNSLITKDLTDESRVFVNTKNGSLIFSSTTASDEGFYVCQVLSSTGVINLNRYDLKIIENLKFVPQPTSKNLELGSIGKIHCRAQGTPTPSIKWIKDGDDNLPESVEDRNGTLVFRNVSSDHNGNYTCIAFSPQGEISASVTITVVVAPKFAIFSDGPVTTLEMGDTMLHCQATGDPEPTIQWDKDLVYLNNNNTTDENRFQILKNGTLLIQRTHLDDEGQYGCTIGNSAGLKREEIQLIVKASEMVNSSEDKSDGFVITLTVLILMSIALAYIIFVVALLAWGKYKRSKGRQRLTLSKQTEETCDEENMDKEIDPCLIEKCEKISPKSNSKNHHETQNGPSHSNGKPKRVLNTNYQVIAKSDLIQHHQLGRGYFGDVFIMHLTNVPVDNRQSRTSLADTDEIKSEKTTKDVPVLVKTMKKTKEENVGVEFKRELDMFWNINHDNVSKLYGLCNEDGFHGMVMEWTDWGDFKQFLIATMCKENSTSPPLKMAQMLTAAHQISKGLDAIYRGRFIHKDVATRNCIISSNFCVKISYSALCMDKYSQEYYKHLNDFVPLRWMAPECLLDDDYSTKSDVHAFGVLVWEIFTHSSSLPVEALADDEFMKKLKDKRIERSLADNTPESLRDILMSCWNQNPKERPSFSQLATALGNELNIEYSKTKTES